MRSEIEALANEIRQAIGLLRRRLRLGSIIEETGAS
ncbi:MAG: hypothetical protein JSC085_000647 [Candidatus Tokpelaia sp. JSC085]|nr:MAG: hypothetical protein JSC085_000647 [Candidatus Tokpelaia sp. JSC085]